MGFLSGGYAAGGGRDALESLWQLLAREEDAQVRRAQEADRIKLDERRVTNEEAFRRAQQELLNEDRAAKQAALAQTSALKLADSKTIGQELDPDAVETLEAGGMGDTVKAPTLSSRNLGGSLRMLTSQANLGKGPSFLGTAGQRESAAQDAELDRQITLASPQLRGRLSMLRTLPGDKRSTALTEVLREEAKPEPKPAAAQEYEYAVKNGFKGTFEQYQNADANRKKPVINVSGQQTNTALKLADDYTRDSKDFATMNQAMRKIVASAKDPSAAGDMALLYGYMKILDPNSVVRETEFATAAKSGSLPQQIQAAASKVLNGQRLTPEQRQDFVARAAGLYSEAKATNENVRKSYSERGKKFGVDPSLIFTDIGEPEMPTAAPAAAGRVYYDSNGNPIKKQ